MGEALAHSQQMRRWAILLCTDSRDIASRHAPYGLYKTLAPHRRPTHPNPPASQFIVSGGTFNPAHIAHTHHNYLHTFFQSGQNLNKFIITHSYFPGREFEMNVIIFQFLDA